jgi:DNA sulfur modification protein DndB
MATPIPAIRGKMGSTPYYVATMAARDLILTTRPAAEDRDKWTSASIDERMQREPYMKRVREQIVPYLAEHKDRFFGSIIVVVPEGSIEFDPVTNYARNLPPAYRQGGEAMGFIILLKGERVILDGQHRWYAEREVIQSPEYLGDEQGAVGDDDLTVIFVENTDPRKTRGIFNKVNRYAKPTTRSDNILTSEDDGYFIVTRRLLDPDNEDAPLAERVTEDDEGRVSKYELVQWRSSTLTKTMRHLTTIGAVAENVKSILVLGGRDDLDRIVSPPEPVLEAAFDEVAPWFFTLLDRLDAYREALADPDSIKVTRFDVDHPHTLLLRPVGQIALIRGITRAMELSRDRETGQLQLTLVEAVERINKIDFSGNANSIWRDTIVRASGRMVARNEAYNLAADLLAYLIASEYYTTTMRDDLREAWNRARGKETDRKKVKELAAQGVIDELPENLPAPVK